MQITSQLIVIGGGAAGFFGAIRAKQGEPKLDVQILESAGQCLGKVKISGGGRCNVTHACEDVNTLVTHYPRGQRELKGVFSRFGPQDTVQWFQEHGVALKTEADGRMFPVTDDSQTIIECLLRVARSLGIRIRTRTPVRHVHRLDDMFQVDTSQGTETASTLLLATGSSRKAYDWVQALGHHVIPPVPSLFTFTIPDATLTALSGTTLSHVRGRLKIGDAKPIIQEGPLLITHHGLSGPVILRLSAWGARLLHQANYQADVVLDVCPQHTLEALQNQLRQEKQKRPNAQMGGENLMPNLTKRFWQWLLTRHDLPLDAPWKTVPDKKLNQLAEGLKQTTLPMRGMNRFQSEFVTAGGVSLKEIDLRTMESRLIPGLFFAGEILNVDALTGGFNFQNAWSTGWIAGESIAQKYPFG